MSSGSSGGGVQQIKTGPPDYLKPYVTGSAAAGQQLFQSGGPQVWPGSTIANRSPETQQAWAGTAARAMNGSPLTGAAQGWARGMLDGTSPTFGPLGQSVWSQLSPRIGSMFSLAGRYGGNNAHPEALARGFTEGIAPTFASLQGHAADLANPLANQDYTDMAALGQVGQARDEYGQSLMTDAYNRFQAQQQRPYSNLDWYTSQLYGSPWGKQSQPAPTQTGFNWGGFLGGALGAAAARV